MLLHAFLIVSSTVLVRSFLFGGGGGCGCGCAPPPPPTVRCAPPGGFRCPPCGCGNSLCAGGAVPPPVSACNRLRPPQRCECGCGRKKRELLGWSEQNKPKCESEHLSRVMLMSVNNSAAVWTESIQTALRIQQIHHHYLPFCSANGSKMPLHGQIACEATHNGNTCRLIKTKAKATAESTLQRTLREEQASNMNL